MQSFSRRLFFKYSNELAPTLQPHDLAFEPTLPAMISNTKSEKDEEIEPSKLDVGQRNLTSLSPFKQKLFSVLDLMVHATIVTPAYYQLIRKELYSENNDVSYILEDFIKIIQDAEAEVVIYQGRLNEAKKLLKNI